MSSAAGNNRQMCCLICSQMQPKNSFLTHISEHLNYRQHKCQECEFESVTAEEMADHEAATEHLGHAVRNAYMDRVCRFIYNDCDFGEKNGGLAKVLKRKLVSANEEEAAGHSNPQSANNNPNPLAMASKTSTTTTNALPSANCGAIFGGNGTTLAANPSMVLKAEECALPSPKVVVPSSTDQQIPMPPSSTIGQHSQSNSGSATPFSHSQEWIASNPLIGHSNSAASELSTAANLFVGMKMDLEGGNGQFFHPQQIVMPDGEIRSEFPPEDADDFLEQAFGGATGGQCSSSALKHDQQSALEKFIAEQQQHIAGGSGQQQMLFDEHQLQQEEEVGGEEEDEGDEQPANADDAANSKFDQIKLRRTNAPRHKNVGNNNDGNGKNKKELKQSFQNVKCLKCGQWVKGRGICLLYHINTRHLKLPMFRCLACPRDFYYVTDTTAKNHIRSFHGNDQSLLENNYPTMSKTLHESRREFFGINVMRPGRSSKLAAKRAKATAKKAAAIASKAAKEITIRDRPQAGSNVAGNSSHLQCAQCGEFVATIYASQLGHMNTKHLHLGVFHCKLCDRQFESLSNSSAIMHVKSAHSKNKTEAISFITDRREQCLKQLNESYRTYFN